MYGPHRILIIILLLIFSLLISFKVIFFDYTPAVVLPRSGYQVHMFMNCEGHGDKVRVRAMLPVKNKRQEIFDEQPEEGNFNFSLKSSNGNRIGLWQKSQITGRQQFGFKFSVKTKEVRFQLPEALSRHEEKGKWQKYLIATELIQVNAQSLKDVISDLDLNKNSDLMFATARIYQYMIRHIKNTDFSGKTDALTTLKLEKASCNGKSRLMVALLRTIDIPARLVGGLILKPGRKSVTHQWLEIRLGDNWVPFDPTNEHYAELPENYLIFYYGDEPLFRRTANINFRYQFDIEKELFSRESNFSGLANHPLNIMNAWSLFQRSGLSLDLLRIILMIPVGAVVTIIFRNVIGIRTFGTFLPALIASAFRGSGLFWGVIAFSLIILIGAAIRSLLDKLHITHTPKLTILLVFVVLGLLTISAVGVMYDNFEIARANIFPLALMAITIERFALTAQESGNREAFTIFANTLITVLFCYMVINSFFLQTFVLAFPESLLLVICAGLYFGNWMGLRVTEFFRFKHLILQSAPEGKGK